MCTPQINFENTFGRRKRRCLEPAFPPLQPLHQPKVLSPPTHEQICAQLFTNINKRPRPLSSFLVPFSFSSCLFPLSSTFRFHLPLFPYTRSRSSFRLFTVPSYIPATTSRCNYKFNPNSKSNLNPNRPPNLNFSPFIPSTSTPT